LGNPIRNKSVISDLSEWQWGQKKNAGWEAGVVVT
jgi:hypothetical protein